MSIARAAQSGRETGHGAVCVVVVGRSALESSLRRGEGIELVRARTATDALGEVAVAASDAHFGAIGVAVAAEAVAPEQMGELLGAIRGVCAHARILGVVSDPSLEGSRFPEAAVDALVRDTAGAEEVLALIAGTMNEKAAPATPNGAPAADAPDAPDASTERVVEAMRETALTECLLSGAPLLGAALAELRLLPGMVKVRFAPGEGSAAEGPSVPVRRQGKTLGVLVAAGADEATLRDAAAWLGAWLALEEQHRQLREAAFTDELTGAWNRRYFTRFLSRAIEQARASRRDVTLMVYDIDDFKHYNDRFGHAAGDEILRETVRLLQSVIRPTDRVCRVGGDEFAVVFDDPRGPRSEHSHHPVSIGEIAERFQRQVCSHRFPKLEEEAQSTLTISGGMATFPWDGHDVASLVERADQLALESKRQGKNLITLGPGAARVCRLRFSDEGEGPGAGPEADGGGASTPGA